MKKVWDDKTTDYRLAPWRKIGKLSHQVILNMDLLKAQTLNKYYLRTNLFSFKVRFRNIRETNFEITMKH